jgi:hypothetical protein
MLCFGPAGFCLSADRSRLESRLSSVTAGEVFSRALVLRWLAQYISFLESAAGLA